MVTIGVRDFDIIVSKASGSAIADGEYGGGSWVKRDANALTDIILHLPELRYFARQVVEAHAKMPDIVRTYEAYTLARSHEIEAKLAGVVAQIFPLYAKWKKAHKPGHEHLSETTNWHSGTKSVIDSILKLFDGRLVSSPHWAAGRGDVGPQMSVVAKSYLSWHALRAIAEITVELEKARSELAEVSKIGLGSLIYDKKPAVAAKEARVRGLEKILEELSVARSYDSRTPTTNGENTPSEGKQTLNFVQATCGEMVREKLREIYIKPFFEKLDLVYGADRQIGRVKDGSITIPSETHVKIAFGGGDGMPSYTGYASV